MQSFGWDRDNAVMKKNIKVRAVHNRYVDVCDVTDILCQSRIEE